MATLTPALRAEIARHLRESNGIRFGMVLRDLEQGLNAEQIASHQRIPLAAARGYVCGVEALLNGKLPMATSQALKIARIYRYLRGCNLSPALRIYITSCLNRLAAINAEIRVDDPFVPGTLRESGTVARQEPEKPPKICPTCFTVLPVTAVCDNCA